MALSDVIARLAVSLSLETATFERNSGRAKREVSSLQSHVSKAGTVIKTAFVGMAGAIAAIQFTDLAKRGLEYASSLGEVASQLGVTTKALQEYRYAASQAGVETGEMDQALSQLTRRLGDAAMGAKEPAAALERLGISVRDSNGHVRDAGDTIPLIAEGLQRIESPAERAAILVDLFGKAGQKLAPLLEGGAAGVNNLRDAAHELGLVLSEEQIQKADDTADKLSAMKQVLEAKIAGAVADNAESILDLANALIKLVEAAGKAAKAWRYFSQLDWSPGAGSFSEQFARMQREELGPGVQLTRPPTPSELAAIATNRARGASAVKVDQRFLAPSGGSLRTVPKRAPAMTPWGPLVQPGLARAVGGNAFGGGFGNFAPGQGAAGWMSVAAAANDAAKPTAVVAGLWEKMAGTDAPRLLDTIRAMKPELEALRGQTQGILDRLFPDEAEARRYAEELAILNAALDKGQISLATHGQAVIALRREYSGFGEAVEQAAQIVGQNFGPSIEAISDQISDRLPKELGAWAGKSDVATVRVAQSFADMAQGVTGSLNQLSNSLRGGGFLDILTSVIGFGIQLGSAGVFGKGVQTRLNKVPAYAAGTNFHPGGIALVGERGPELVDLPRGARVTPNNELGGRQIVEIVDTTGLFRFRVGQQIVEAAPAIMVGSAKVTTSRLGRRQSRALPA